MPSSMMVKTISLTVESRRRLICLALPCRTALVMAPCVMRYKWVDGIHIIQVRQRHGRVTFELAGNLESVAGIGREFLKIICEPAGLYFDGMKVSRQGAGKFNGLLDQFPATRPASAASGSDRLANGLAKDMAGQSRAGQMLARTVGRSLPIRRCTRSLVSRSSFCNRIRSWISFVNMAVR